MAFVDTRKLESGHTIEADLCVVGSGAAGLTIASSFFDRPEKVVVLESGGMQLEPETQALYRGEVVGQAHAPLDKCRLRLFGGTTNHWTAHVRPLDDIDFEERGWVPYSGWPFGPAELAPYYPRVDALLGLPAGAFARRSAPEGEPDPMEQLGLDTDIRYVLPPERRLLGRRLARRIQRSRNVDVYLHANVLRIGLNEARNRVGELEIGTLDGLRLRARARFYVIAAGGIENPRILLLSSIRGQGDASRPLVGAFFANHPGSWAGYIEPLRPGLRIDAAAHFRLPDLADEDVRPLLRLDSRLQRERWLLNCWLELRSDSVRDARRFAHRTSTLPTREQEKERRWRAQPDVATVGSFARELSGLPAPGPDAAPVILRIIAEATPNPSSRVRLSDDLDAFGQRRVELDWRLSPADSSGVERTLATLACSLGAAGLGRLRVLFPKRGFESIATTDSHHHMGTTRMHRDPKLGVVDPSCRVHGVSNLYVAGSSVFPTSGTANPTYTIIALAYRLADHLAASLRGGA